MNFGSPLLSLATGTLGLLGLSAALSPSGCRADDFEYVEPAPAAEDSVATLVSDVRELPFVTRVAYGEPAFEALVVHDSGDDAALTQAMACAFAEGLANTDFGVDVVSVGQSAALVKQYDLLVLVGGTRHPESQVSVLRAVDLYDDIAGLPVAALVGGERDVMLHLRKLTEALAHRGAVVVESVAFQYPLPNWDGLEPERGIVFVEAEVEAVGRCVGEGLLE